MSIDPRVALESLVAAFEEHLAASASRRSPQDPSVEAAYLEIANAFEAYEDALYDAYGEVTPLEVYDDEEISEDDEEAGDDAAEGNNAGSDGDLELIDD